MSRSDNFNRADGALGTPSDGGSAWVESPNTLWIVSNQVQNTEGRIGQTAILECSQSDGEASIAVTMGAGDRRVGLVGRYVDATNFFTFEVRETGATLWKQAAGDWTSLGTSAGSTAATASSMAIEFSGNDITCKFNGADVITATDSFNNTATKFGIRFDVDATSTADDFAFTDPAGASLTAGTASFTSSGPAGIEIEATDATDGTAPYTYQWQRNENGGSYSDLSDGSGVSGATTLSLIDGSAVEEVLYGYQLVYTDDASGTATSNQVEARVYPGGPITSGGGYSRSRMVHS